VPFEIQFLQKYEIEKPIITILANLSFDVGSLTIPGIVRVHHPFFIPVSNFTLMTTFRSAVFASVGIVAVAFLSSCNHSTNVQNNESSIPRVGSIFNYTDSTWFEEPTFDSLVADSEIFKENDTVIESGTFFSKSNAIRFDSSARDLVEFSGIPTAPYYIAYETSGDISMPSILTLSGADSSIQWLTFPLESHTTFRSVKSGTSPYIGNIMSGDSVIWAPNMTITVGGIDYDCEHAVDYQFQISDSGFSSSMKLDIYFSPTLGIPLQSSLSVQTQSGTWEKAFTKRLVSFTN
jgi:hypothetical protein